MDVMKAAFGCAVAATVAGIAVSQTSPDTRKALFDRASLAVAAAPPPQAVPVQSSAPRPTVATFSPSDSTVTLAPDRYGQFHADMEVDGRRVPVMVDTGASWVALSFEAARDLGYFPAPSDFTIEIRTANGRTRGAPMELAEVRVGSVVAHHVAAMVLQPGAMAGGALLGMSFLKSLSGFAVEGGQMVLRQ